MNTKLSKLVLGSALILGLGASVGSFAQEAAQQMMSESTVLLIQNTPSLMKAASAILGTELTTANAANLATAIASKQSAAATKFAADLNNEQTVGQPWFKRQTLKAREGLARIKTSLMSFMIANGYSQAVARQSLVGFEGPVGQAVVGNSFADCTGKWTDDNAKAVAAIGIKDLNAPTVAAFRKNVVKDSMAKFPGESEAQVQARVSAAFNSEQCDILRVAGVRAAR